MSVRPLTTTEMLELPEGSQAVYIGTAQAYFVRNGQPLTRQYSAYDDDQSVLFSWYDDDGYLCTYFFEDKEVGVVEVTKHPIIVKAAKEQTERPAEELGIYRPELETRKVGKIRVELVDDGFPLALREVAKVMTWAQTAKGYKDHDWQNLPNAEIALAAAASRHRTDYIEQRVIQGLSAVDSVDPESGLVHKAHEAFGVLAQLELLLRGKFVDSRSQIGV